MLLCQGWQPDQHTQRQVEAPASFARYTFALFCAAVFALAFLSVSALAQETSLTGLSQSTDIDIQKLDNALESALSNAQATQNQNLAAPKAPQDVSLQYDPNAPSYVLDNPSHLLIPKSVTFVNRLSNELFAKSGYSLYVAVVDTIPDFEFSESNTPKTNSKSSQSTDSKTKRALYKQQLTQNLKAPYTLILFMKRDEKIDIISSAPHTYLDEDKVFFEYMIPLLPKQKDEVLNPERISAIVLNGYATAADMIAKHYDITLEHNMPVDESGGRDFVRFSMYAMLLVLFGIIGFIYITRKK